MPTRRLGAGSHQEPADRVTPRQMDTIQVIGAPRVLPATPVLHRADHQGAHGGALEAARRLGPDGVVEHLAAAGLRGRGGAGFPTARKWAAVLGHEAPVAPPTVVVNAAEGEPGSFKDRAILRRNPHAVLEGALVAATVIGADRVVVALKRTFRTELGILEAAIRDWRKIAGGLGVEVLTFMGPSHYLYGEETGLLEALEGRPPFPRVAPPYRHGVDEVGEPGSPQPAEVVMSDGTVAPPTLVSNVETFANVPGILANGPAWFRQIGTVSSPGTLVATVTGATRHAGVAEVPMGMPLQEAIERIGGGAREGRRVVAAMSGVANAVLTEDELRTPLAYETMEAVGSGLGAAGFVVFDDATDFAAVAAAASRFLAVESCGQCTPCKQDGLAVARLLDGVRRSHAVDHDLVVLAERLASITDGARCSLATQHQRLVASIARSFGEELRAHVDGRRAGAAEYELAPIVELEDGAVVLDEHERAKQPDWTYGDRDSGAAPAERLATSRPAGERVDADDLADLERD